MQQANKAETEVQAGDEAQTPEVYAVEKDLRGWRFSRREFLAAAGATATATALAGCGGDGGEIQVLDPVSRAEAWRAVRAHEENVRELAWSPDGTLLVSASSDETVKLWSMPEGTMEKKLLNRNGGFTALAISPDGTKMVTGDSGGEIRVWQLPKAKSVRTLTGYWPEGTRVTRVSGLAFTPDGKHFVSGHSASTVMLWDSEDPRSDRVVKMVGPERSDLDWAHQVAGLETTVSDVAVSPDGTRAASAELGGYVRLWSLPGGEAAAVHSIKDGEFLAVAISPDGSILAVAGRDGKVYLWPMERSESIRVLEEQTSKVLDVAFAPDGSFLIAASGQSVYVYTSDGDLSAKLEGAGADVTCLAVSPDGTRLAVGDVGGKIWIWSLPDGELVSALIDLKINNEDTEGIRFSVDGADSKKVTYTLPCGAAVPAGAVCTCNCVGGSVPNCSCVGHTASGGGSHYWHPC